MKYRYPVPPSERGRLAAMNHSTGHSGSSTPVMHEKMDEMSLAPVVMPRSIGPFISNVLFSFFSSPQVEPLELPSKQEVPPLPPPHHHPHHRHRPGSIKTPTRSGNIQNRTYVCGQCDFSSTSAKTFLHHQKDAHSVDITICPAVLLLSFSEKLLSGSEPFKSNILSFPEK
jgi:hypothetical protein